MRTVSDRSSRDDRKQEYILKKRFEPDQERQLAVDRLLDEVKKTSKTVRRTTVIPEKTSSLKFNALDV